MSAGESAPPEEGAEEAGAAEEPGAAPDETAATPPLADALVDRNRARGVTPDGWTAGARWKREDDIPDDVYFRAREAMG